MATVRKSRTSPLMLPGKQWLSRVTFVTLVACSTTLLLLGKTGNPSVERMRNNIADVMMPILSVAASPMDAIYNAGTWTTDMVRLREENLILKNQNAQLLQWQAQAQAMTSENQSLRALLNVVPSQKNKYITVRVVSDLGGPYVHSALVSGGGNEGIKKDQAVISDSGLLGRVVDVGQTSARVLLLTDINSRIPVVGEHSREKAILAGNNTDMPTLAYLPADTKIKLGERIITSGDGGVFPAGIPVGVVTSNAKGTLRVQLFLDAAQAEYVSVIDYAL